MGNPPKMTMNQAITHLNQLTTNLLLTRSSYFASGMDHPKRDLNKECGWPDNPTINDYTKYYEREGLAKKVVDVYPNETWAVDPILYESEDEKDITEWEKQLSDHVDEHQPWSWLHQLDIRSGLGKFGGLFFGFNDITIDSNPDTALAQPVPGIDEAGRRVENADTDGRQLLFMRVFDENLIRVKEIEKNPGNPRFGQPKFYEVRFADVDGELDDRDNDSFGTVVHWTRILHAADNRSTSPIYGTERMKPVFNRLFDLRKVLGGSAEMFWKGAFPGYSFESLPDIVGEEVDMDETSVKEQVDAYVNGLRRYFALKNMTVKPLLPQLADPSKHVEEQLRAISTSLDVPLRIFLGTEAAHLASTQDAVKWNKQLGKRQKIYVNPYLIRPYIQRLMFTGVLPYVPKYFIDWTDLNAMSEKDKADVAMKKAQTLVQYVTGGVETIFPLREFLTIVLGLTTEQANSAISNIQAGNFRTKDVWFKPPAQGLSGGTKPARNSLGSGG